MLSGHAFRNLTTHEAQVGSTSILPAVGRRPIWFHAGKMLALPGFSPPWERGLPARERSMRAGTSGSQWGFALG